MVTGTLQVFPSAEALARGAAEKIIAALNAAVLRDAVPSLVCSGGTTPQAVYELLGDGRYAKRVDWSKIHLFWGDERCVPPDHTESNFHMAQQALLRHLHLPPHHVHRMHGELHPREAAATYEAEIRTVLGVAPPGIPRFSLVLLGLGNDGHTASLFPGTSALAVRDRLATEVFVERLNTWRLTMTYPLLNEAHAVLFLVSGTSKAAVLKRLATAKESSLPALGITPIHGTLDWYCDQDAASLFMETEQQ